MIAKKALVTIMATTITLSALSLTSFAQSINHEMHENVTTYLSGNIIVTPYFIETSSAAAYISKSGTKVSPEIIVKALKTTTKISGTLYLEKSVNGSWQQVASWSVSGTGSISTTKSYTGISGITYRSRFVVTVGSEKIERSSSSCKV